MIYVALNGDCLSLTPGPDHSIRYLPFILSAYIFIIASLSHDDVIYSYDHLAIHVRVLRNMTLHNAVINLFETASVNVHIVAWS